MDRRKSQCSAAAVSGVYKPSYVVLSQQNKDKSLIYKEPIYWLFFIGCSIGEFFTVHVPLAGAGPQGPHELEGPRRAGPEQPDRSFTLSGKTAL